MWLKKAIVSHKEINITKRVAKPGVFLCTHCDAIHKHGHTKEEITCHFCLSMFSPGEANAYNIEPVNQLEYRVYHEQLEQIKNHVHLRHKNFIAYIGNGQLMIRVKQIDQRKKTISSEYNTDFERIDEVCLKGWHDQRQQK
jgi:hypothetical protein